MLWCNTNKLVGVMPRALHGKSCAMIYLVCMFMQTFMGGCLGGGTDGEWVWVIGSY